MMQRSTLLALSYWLTFGITVYKKKNNKEDSYSTKHFVIMDIKSTCLLFSFAVLLMVTFVSGNDCRTSRTVVASAQSICRC